MLQATFIVSPLRRLGAIMYDGLIVLTLCYVASWPLLTWFPQGIAPYTLWYQAYLLLVWSAYFTLSWRACGQTIGMRAWGIVLKSKKKPLPWSTCIKRLGLAWLGWLLLFDLLCMWLHPQSKTTYDLWTGTWLELAN